MGCDIHSHRSFYLLRSNIVPLDNELGLRSGTACMGTLGMSTELDLLIWGQLQRLLEPLTNPHQCLFACTIPTFVFPNGPRPQPDPEEGLPHVDHHSHDLVVTVFLESFAYGGQLRMKPQFVDIDPFLVFELI